MKSNLVIHAISQTNVVSLSCLQLLAIPIYFARFPRSFPDHRPCTRFYKPGKPIEGEGPRRGAGGAS